MSTKLSFKASDLLKEEEALARLRKKNYRIQFQKCLNVVNSAHKDLHQQYTVYNVPLVLPGDPHFSLQECIAYLKEKLTDAEFYVKLMQPGNVLLISWLPEHVRKVKKKAQQKVNEKRAAETQASVSEAAGSSKDEEKKHSEGKEITNQNMSNYVVHDIKSGILDTSQLTLTKAKSIFNIGSGNKQLWLKVNPCVLKYGYRPHQYKNTSPGNIVISDMGDLSEAVEAVEQFVIDTLTRVYKGTTLNNVAVTDKTIQRAPEGMFKSSMYNGTLQVSVDNKGKDKCPIFDQNATAVSSVDLKQVLTAGLAVTIFVQPIFAWMMGEKIGIRWDAKQIKILGSAMDQPDPDSEGEEDDNASAKPRSAAEMLKLFDD
ncbi:hypothetical protein HDU87_000485 [Geranomyces variabilis]|uniref:Uncharacterized protein n=1 Tax=Geranomyces variabilis TaxID=109894 RepID=A0AAD5XMD3_9FUNG|nr:hypothetical protein HDU87_000485 [Geranomyces variabilis]